MAEHRGAEPVLIRDDADLSGLHSDVFQIERDGNGFQWGSTPTSRIDGEFIKECCSHVLHAATGEYVLDLPHTNGYGWITLPHADGECEAHLPPKIGPGE